jgi:AmmeMemoRadiSam system protein B
MDDKVRKPAVAGRFYPGTRVALESELKKMIPEEPGKRERVIGLVVPHAGYMYSGACAGRGFGRVELPQTVILLGTDHHGVRFPLTVDGHDEWETPLGRVALDGELRVTLSKSSRLFVVDPESGREEHSLEVQVPFIQYLKPEAKLLPIVVSSRGLSELLEGGREIGRLFSGRSDLMMVASTDMSHYIPADEARELDFQAIGEILRLDPEGLYQTVSRLGISMCGVAPTVVMLAAAREAGATRAELIDYTHSGEVSGNLKEVVGYASIIVR